MLVSWERIDGEGVEGRVVVKKIYSSIKTKNAKTKQKGEREGWGKVHSIAQIGLKFTMEPKLPSNS